MASYSKSILNQSNYWTQNKNIIQSYAQYYEGQPVSKTRGFASPMIGSTKKSSFSHSRRTVLKPIEQESKISQSLPPKKVQGYMSK